MRKFDVQIALEGVREAREKWVRASMKFKSDIDFVMTRLLHEAAVNRMSVGEVAMMSGFTVKQVRELMRRAGLDPKTSKTLLAKQAADVLASNAALMGVEPHEMDLTSPLAYLPMGSELKQQLIEARVHRVTELDDEVSGNVTVSADDLRAVLQAADYVNNKALVGPVDRMGDALAIVTMKADL